MGISYEEAVAAQAKIEDELLKDPNVVSVGVIEEVNDFGQKTDNYVIQVGVISIEIYQNAVKHGSPTIPPEYILHSENGIESEKHIRINVVREGKIEALNRSMQLGKEDLPSAIGNIQNVSGIARDTTLRRRHSPCSQSVGHPAGTVGLTLKYVFPKDEPLSNSKRPYSTLKTSSGIFRQNTDTVKKCSVLKNTNVMTSLFKANKSIAKPTHAAKNLILFAIRFCIR